MAFYFRNVDADVADPVESWPAEAVRASLEGGGLSLWRRLAGAAAADPWGPVARAVEEALAVDPPYGSGALMREVVARARESAERCERAAVAAEVRDLVARSGLTGAAYANRIGTSASRLSTYCTGAVTPSAALLLRMRRVTSKASEQP